MMLLCYTCGKAEQINGWVNIGTTDPDSAGQPLYLCRACDEVYK